MPRLCALLFVLAIPAGAQIYTDAFNYPDGTVVPGWTERRGDWAISQGRLYAVVPNVWSYITKIGFNLRNCALEATVFYEGPSSRVQFGGLCARHNGGSNDTNLVMCKVQDNSQASGVGFDSYWTWERPNSSLSGTISPSVLAARVRLVVREDRATTWVDRDLNGTWDTNHELTLNSYLSAGEVGISAYLESGLLRSSGCDDFSLYDAVVTTASTARPGSRVLLRFRSNTPGIRYQGACALQNYGIPVDTRRIPLVVDGLFWASLLYPSVFENFSGNLDGSAHAAVYINIPSSPPLVGLRFYTAFVTIDPGGSPSGIRQISHDLPMTIQS